LSKAEQIPFVFAERYFEAQTGRVVNVMDLAMQTRIVYLIQNLFDLMVSSDSKQALYSELIQEQLETFVKLKIDVRKYF
jgi:hypothetical protein